MGREAAQRIDVREDKQQHEGGRRERVEHGDRKRVRRHSEHCEPHERGQRSGHDDGAERAAAVGGARRQGDRKQAQNHRHGQHNADGLGIEILGCQPNRQERQVDTECDEHAGVEQRHSPHKMSPCKLLEITRHRIDCT